MASYESHDEEKDMSPELAQPKFLPITDPPTIYSSETTAIDATSIFILQKLLLRIPKEITGEYSHLTVSKNWLICLLATPTKIILLRFFLPRAIPPGEIALEKYLAGYKISKLFLDPTGYHLLVSLVPKSPGLSADFLYIHGNGPKVRRIEKFKDHEITAVAFNHYAGTESSTGPILLGTSRGLIFETELMQDADKPSYRKQVYDLGLGRSKYPITSLEVIRRPNTNKYIVIATAPDCIYTFHEKLKPEDKSLQNIFIAYLNGIRVHNVEEVKTDLNYSVLRFFAHPNDKFPSKWGWLCGAGIRVGQLGDDDNSEAILLGDELISLDFDKHKHLTYEERKQNVPKTFVLTEYHALLLYSDHITGICLLNQEVIYEEYFTEKFGKLLDIVRDPFTGIIYLYTDRTVFKYKITEEDRNMWKIHLDKGMYDEAEIYAAENPVNLDVVLTKKAETAFEAKQYELSARIYAQTQKTFEEVCLKFMELEDKRAIIIFAKKRLNACGDSEDHLLVLVIWLTDLYLLQVNLPGRSIEERTKWQREFDEFMRDERVVECTRANKEIIHDLIAQHADSHNLSQFAIANEDYEEVINQQLSADKYSEILLTLRKQTDMELYYKYCPIIMEFLPHETVEILISQGRKLQIEKLVPTLITMESTKHIDEVLKYLEYAIYNLGETNQAIHNWIVRLYAEHNPTKVIAYLENEGHDVTLVHYEIYYVLKICTDFALNVACVFLQCLLEMWSAAVDLALTFDVQLAKETAQKPKDTETRRKLWLRIAHHDIQGTNNVKKALALLKECDMLRIEDLLPFFSDFEKIDDFKEPICDALKEYNQKIQELQHDMEECSNQAERVANDLQNVREHSICIEAHEICTLCETFLLVKPFFLFACGHKFHSDCLEKQVVPMLSSDKSRKLTMLKQQLESLLTQSAAMADLSLKHQQQRDKLKQEIEEILASDCLYCAFMINTIDQPFVEDWDQVNVDWE